MNPQATLRRFLWMVVGVALAFGCYFLANNLTFERVAHAQVNVIPFTLQFEHFDVRANPKGQLDQKAIVARRSDGAEVDAGSAIGNDGQEIPSKTRGITMPDGSGFMVMDTGLAFVKWPAPPTSEWARVKEMKYDPQSNCLLPGATFLQYGTILGQRVAISRYMTRESRVTDWRALDLQCTSLQYKLETKQDDGSFKPLTEARPVSLVLGEPDPLLFDIPLDYTSTRPSEALRRQAVAVGNEWTPEMDEVARGIDGKYDRVWHDAPSSNVAP